MGVCCGSSEAAGSSGRVKRQSSIRREPYLRGSMPRFREWLTATKRAVTSNSLGPTNKHKDRLRVVMGNTSCDVDSAIGALVLAYYYSLKLKQQWVPVINCNRADFYCNLEIVTHLQNC